MPKPAQGGVLQALASSNPYFLGPAGTTRADPDFAQRVEMYVQQRQPQLWAKLANPQMPSIDPNDNLYNNTGGQIGRGRRERAQAAQRARAGSLTQAQQAQAAQQARTPPPTQAQVAPPPTLAGASTPTAMTPPAPPPPTNVGQDWDAAYNEARQSISPAGPASPGAVSPPPAAPAQPRGLAAPPPSPSTPAQPRQAPSASGPKAGSVGLTTSPKTGVDSMLTRYKQRYG